MFEKLYYILKSLESSNCNIVSIVMANILVSALLIFCCAVQSEELCLRHDFQDQFQQILGNGALSDEEVANSSYIISDLATTFNKKWPGATLTLFGSRMSGLALKSSDIDILVSIPGSNDTLGNSTITDVLDLLAQEPDLYANTTSTSGRVALVKTLHVPSQKNIDLSFKDSSAIAKNSLLHYFMFSDPRIRQITLFLKIWSRTRRLPGSYKHPSYAMALMSVFYFQQKQMLPTVHEVQRNSQEVILHGYNHGFNTIPINSRNNESIYELLGGFFRYYREFDFENYIISPFVGKPLSKRLFSDVATIPSEFAFYKQKLLAGTTQPMKFHAKMIVQEAFEHNNNLVPFPEMYEIVNHITKAANMFDVTPANRVLSAILKTDQNDSEDKKESVSNDKANDEECSQLA